MRKKSIIAVGVLSALSVLSSAAVLAQNYPSRTVRFIVPYTPGGAADILARAVGAKLTEAWGQSVVVENRAGAGTNIGMEAVARSAPDGYTLLLGGVTIATNPSLYSKLPFDPAKDLAPVSLLVAAGNVLVVNPELPVKTVKELIEYAGAHPGELNYGSPSTGSTPHLAGELFGALTGTKLVHVPYKGAALGLNDLIAGRLQLSFDNIPPAIAHIRGGKLRALAVTSAQRSALLPEIPTVIEAGLAGFDVSAWFGLLAPAGTPREAILRVQAETVKALQTGELRERLNQFGFEVVGSTPEAFGALIQSEILRWAKIIRESGARAD
ncbi:MAG: tripartite tricarboxylate transporter substrate binding protein [Proteobacteria bacterium]|nr:tripartite tricarboxylate transporter substrate binding protein [Pseudomonadota bacterium]